MDQHRLFKIAEERFTEHADKVGSLQARVEDLLYRAQRIAATLKNKKKPSDVYFLEDIQLLRRAVKSLAQEGDPLPALLDRLGREASYEPGMLNAARSLLAAVTRAQKVATSLRDGALMLHQHAQGSESKVEAWLVAQELEMAAQKLQRCPSLVANRILNRLTTSP